MFIKDNENHILWYIIFAIQWTLSITCFVLLLNINYYQLPYEEVTEPDYAGKDKPLMNILTQKVKNEYSLYFGYWKGTYEGCLCDNNTILKDNCTYNNQSNCKEEIPAVKGSYMYTYRGSKFYHTPSKYNYNDLFNMSVDENENCKEGFKKCGKLDFFNNTLCLPENEDCPVNYLEITNSSTPPNDKYNFTSVRFKDGYYIHYTNEAIDNYTIKNYFRSGDDKACINFLDYNDTFPVYSLNQGKCSYRHNNLYASEYYYKVDTTSKLNVIVENKKNRSLGALPFYPYSDLAKANYSLSIGIFLGYNRTCRDDILKYKEVIKGTEELITPIKYYNIALFSLFSMLSFCILPVFFLIKEEHLNIFNIIIIVYLSIVFVLSYFSYYYAKQKTLLYECFDPKFQSYLKQPLNQITQMKVFPILFMSYCVLYIILYLFDIPYNGIKKCIHRKKKNHYEPLKIN